MDKREKLKLSQEKETLLVPLYCRAVQAQKSNPILQDEKAVEILGQLDYDFSQLRTPAQTLFTLAVRAKKLDEYARNYESTVENPLFLHLGCGLDSRVLRVKHSRGQWYDLDYPEVIELRRMFYTETDNYHMIASPVMDLLWLDEILHDGPACIIAEGLLMYLEESDVRELFARLHERFPGSEICFDTYSRLTVSRIRRHPAIQKTGASIHWGIDDVSEVEAWDEGYKVLEEWYFTQSTDVAAQGFFFRLMYRLAGSIRAAQKAHRIIRMQI